MEAIQTPKMDTSLASSQPEVGPLQQLSGDEDWDREKEEDEGDAMVCSARGSSDGGQDHIGMGNGCHNGWRKESDIIEDEEQNLRRDGCVRASTVVERTRCGASTARKCQEGDGKEANTKKYQTRSLGRNSAERKTHIATGHSTEDSEFDSWWGNDVGRGRNSWHVDENDDGEDSFSASKSSLSIENDTLPCVDSDEIQPFLRHKVEKSDTLAGLAVKYKVSVADIKRANGLDSDNTMYGRGILLVPTRPMPLSAELAAWIGLSDSHVGHRGLSSRLLRPGVVGALTELRGYYSTGASLNPSPLYSDEDQDDLDSSMIDFEAIRQGTLPRNRKSPREVELMTRNSSQSAAYMEERLRRRKNPGEAEDFSEAIDTSYSNVTDCVANLSPLSTPNQPSRTISPSEAWRRRGGGSVGGLQDINFKEWKRRGQQWKEQMLNRLKRAASQPALLQTAASLVSKASNVGTMGMTSGNAPATQLTTGLGFCPMNSSPGPLQKNGHKAD